MEGKEGKYSDFKSEGKYPNSSSYEGKSESKISHTPEGTIEVTRDPKAIKIVEGFRMY